MHFETRGVAQTPPIQLVVYMPNFVSISKASKYLGKSPSYLRHLEEQGVLIPDEHTSGGHRRYSLETLNRFLEALEGSGVCGVFLGMPDLDFPSGHADQLRSRMYQKLMGMGFVGLEDITPSIYDGSFYSNGPRLMEFISRPDVAGLAIPNHEVIPQEALAMLLNTCSVFNVQVHLLMLK